MAQAGKSFIAAKIGARIKNGLTEFDELLAQAKNDELLVIRKKFRDSWKEYRNRGAINVAFVGQYNAGKSTMISALTGRRDIRIDSDIATDKTTNYDWNGIKLVDTPGLFTDRKDHDEITYEAIDSADLLVFSLTYMLFDSVTIANFKELAYERGYRWKMMLTINKMSDEAGEEEQKITNYRKSLATALDPYRLDEFPLCFIDAKDYCEGMDEEDDFLVEISRFQSFIDALNSFVERRASLTKFDTPIRIVLRYLDDAQNIVMRDSTKDTAFFELLLRLARSIQQERDRLRTRIKSITLQLSAAVANEGTTLADMIGVEKDIESYTKQAEIKVQNHYEKAGIQIQREVESISNSTKEAVAEVLQSELFHAFEARLGINRSVSMRDIASNVDAEKLQRQVNTLKEIGTSAGVEIRKLAVNSGTVGASQGILSASNVAGSNLHQAVYHVGKFIGVDFKPWQAVNIAKDIANVMTFVGPILGVISLGVEMHAMGQDKKNQEKIMAARLDVTSQFVSIAKDLEDQVEEQIREFETQFFGSIEKQISEARQREQEEIKISNHYFRQLVDLHNVFEVILNDISQAVNR